MIYIKTGLFTTILIDTHDLRDAMNANRLCNNKGLVETVGKEK